MSDKVKAEEAMRELTLMLLYLSRFAHGEKFDKAIARPVPSRYILLKAVWSRHESF